MLCTPTFRSAHGLDDSRLTTVPLVVTHLFLPHTPHYPSLGIWLTNRNDAAQALDSVMRRYPTLEAKAIAHIKLESLPRYCFPVEAASVRH